MLLIYQVCDLKWRKWRAFCMVQDMRHRLAADGTRYGKVIAYKMSELRMDALLSTLCDEELKSYQWVEPSEGEHFSLQGPVQNSGTRGR